MWCNAGSMGGWGWTMMVILWGGIGALIFWTIRSTSWRRGQPQSDPIEILERRFASGDIAQDEYEERRRLLGSRP